MRFSTKHDFERRRGISSSQRSENRSWWRREDAWANERKHRTHSHRYHARSNALKRRFKKINVIDQNTSKHLQLSDRYLQEFSWNSRVDRIDVEQRRDLSSCSNVRAFAASSIFEETASCALTRRDERHSEQRWRQSWFAREFVARRHKTQNQSAMINHRHVIDRLTTFIQSCKQHWDVRNDCRRHDLRQRRIWKRILDQKLDTFLTAFRFRILLENDLEKLRQRSIRLDNVEISRRKISHKRHHESFKKDFFWADKKNRQRE